MLELRVELLFFKGGYYILLYGRTPTFWQQGLWVSYFQAPSESSVSSEARGNLESGLQIRVRNQKLFFLFLNQTICCGCSKEPSQGGGLFEHPQHMLKLVDKKKIFKILY